MRDLKLFWFFLLALGLAGHVTDPSFVRAGGDPADTPHETHLSHSRGPSILLDKFECERCHDGSPAWDNVNTSACETCHGPGGLYDGVNDPTIGALNNWENRGGSSAATKSLIYNSDGSLKTEKEFWCAACHDQSATGLNIISGFEGATEAEAISGWWAGYDIVPYPAGVKWTPMFDWENRTDQGISGYWTEFQLKWTQDPAPGGSVRKTLNPTVDFSTRDSFNFYLKVDDNRMFLGVVVYIIDNSPYTESTCTFRINNITTPDINVDQVKDHQWRLVSLPRAGFTGDSWDSLTEADEVRMLFYEAEPTGTYTYYFALDEIGCDVTGPNVIGDNQTWGAYTTGHGFCTFCHDPSSQHIDGNRLTPLEYAEDFTLYDHTGGFYNENPTNHRFYNDPNRQMTLPLQPPFTVDEIDTDMALCTSKCHPSSVLFADVGGGGPDTNFTNEGNSNLHAVHVPSPTSQWYPTGCVACHDPHGQAGPAMTRREMGGFIIFDEYGCEIEYGQDSNQDGTPDRFDAAVNVGGADTEGVNNPGPGSLFGGPLCGATCHNYGYPPNSADCLPENNPYGGSAMEWYYRDYQFVRHGGVDDIGPGCFSAGCHTVSKSHASHFYSVRGPDLSLDEAGCNVCHGNNACQKFADNEPLGTTTVCDSCHSSGGP